MKECGTSRQGVFLHVFYSLSFSYGYDFMLKTASVIIKDFFRGQLSSFRVSKLPGMRVHNMTLYVKLHGLQLNKCRLLKKEYGEMEVQGHLERQKREILLSMLNQTNQVRLSIRYFNDDDVQMLNNLMDDIILKVHDSYSEL